MSELKIRLATEADVPAILRMGDEAVAWLVAQGRTGQWGSKPWTGSPERAEAMTKRLTSCEFYLAEIDGRLAGAMAAGREAQPYIPAVGEPEMYIQFLITGGDFRGLGVGATLLAHARERAEAWGVGLVRVDCYAGDDRKLVAFYTSQGFEPLETFKVGEWPGQVLGYRLQNEEKPVHMSDRLVLRPGTFRERVAEFMRPFGWPVAEDVRRDEVEGVDGVTEWAGPDDIGSFFYCEDADFGVPFIAASGPVKESVDAFMSAAGTSLDAWTLSELYRQFDTAEDTRTAAEATLLLGIGAPNAFTGEVFDRIASALGDEDENVRWTAVWATTYTGYDEFIPSLRAVAENDEADFVRGRAANVLGVFEDMRGLPSYTEG